MDIVLLIGYVLVGLFTMTQVARRFAWAEADSYGQEEPDAEDKGFGLFFGFFAGAVWPGVVVALVLGCLIDVVNDSERFWSRPRAVKVKNQCDNILKGV